MGEPLVESFKRPEWSPHRLEGSVGVEGKVILDTPDLILACSGSASTRRSRAARGRRTRSSHVSKGTASRP